MMKLEKLDILIVVFLFSFLLLFFSKTFPLLARQMTPEGVIRGNVRMNICGDMIAEGVEHCDRIDLRGQTCKSFDFNSGSLSCNFLCEFDLSQCSYEEDNTPEDQPDEETEEEESPIVDERTYYDIVRQYLPSLPIREEQTLISDLPSAIQFLKFFDKNNNGIIESNELPILVLSWVNAWKYGMSQGQADSPTCDLNNDSICNILDFSILMSYLDENFSLTQSF